MNKREHFHNSIYARLQTIAGLGVYHTYVERRNYKRPFVVVSIDPAQMQPEYYENAELSHKRGECMVAIRLFIRAASNDVDGLGLLRQEYNLWVHLIETALDNFQLTPEKFGTMIVENAVCSVVSEAPLFDDAEQDGEGIIFARIDYTQRYE
jgi:hypothetical protein